MAEICAIIDRQWNGEAVANLSFKNKYGSDTCSMKVFVIEIIQSPVGWVKLLLIFFFTYRSGIVRLNSNLSAANSIGEEADSYSVLSYVLDSKAFAITGGEFGVESSVIALIAYIVVAVFAFVMIKKKRKD